MKERIKALCREHNISMNKLEESLGFGKGYISKLGNSVPSTAKIKQIADFFNVSVDYLMSGNEENGMYTCPDCGFSYLPTEYEDAKCHMKIHTEWEKAVSKFGTLYCNSAENEKIKQENRAIRNNKNNSIEDRYNAEINVLRCLFSRSVEANHFDLDHVTFEEYVAMMLNNEIYRDQIGNELSKKIIDNFGTMPGIKNGESIYFIPEKKKSLTKKDNRDISKDIDSIMKKLSSKEYGPAAYNGQELSEESIELFREELNIALRRLKIINKEKYNPNKNKK